MRRLLSPPKNVLRWLAATRSIYAALIAVAAMGAVLPSVRLPAASSALQTDAARPGAARSESDDKDHNQSQGGDSDTDPAQDLDLADMAKLFVTSERDPNDALAPELILIPNRHAASAKRRHRAAHLSFAERATDEVPAAPRPVHSRICRLML